MKALADVRETLFHDAFRVGISIVLSDWTARSALLSSGLMFL